jgi:hypothetical protein
MPVQTPLVLKLRPKPVIDAEYLVWSWLSTAMGASVTAIEISNLLG